MITFTPITQEEVGTAGNEFFKPELAAERLGGQGRWFGWGAETLHLQNPVRQPVFQNLLHGLTPDGTRPLAMDTNAPRQPAGWRLTFSASLDMSALWAMSDRGPRLDIERAHAQAVKIALIDIQHDICGLYAVPIPGLEPHPGALSAYFRAGASPDQVADLHTTVFLFNLAVRTDGTVKPFAEEKVFRATEAIVPYYLHLLSQAMDCRLGPVSEVRCKHFPIWEPIGEGRWGELFARDFEENRRLATDLRGRPLRGEELFALWRAQGQAIGFGPREAAAYVDALKRRQSWNQFKDSLRHRFDVGRDALRQLLQSRKPQAHDQRHGPERSPSWRSRDRGQTHSH